MGISEKSNETVKNNDNIIIKLSESRNAKIFDKNSRIHRDEFKKAQGWIKERIEIVKKQEEDEGRGRKERLHDTISILGSRGSGKTSFLHSLLDYFRENKKNDVEIIDIIDPTLIEEKGHIFLTLISQIAKVVGDKISKSDCNPESFSYQEKKEWEKKLMELAAGIPSIDGVGDDYYEHWQDPEFIMDKGLRSVGAAKSLEVDFHELLKFGLKILKKKMFIMAFDDIDINFQKGWPVLETIRKYLTSPYLVVLLSGDIKLFSKAIRKRQWSNFGKALLVNEGEKLNRITDYDDLVTEMESQYLLKVLQPQRRIHLTTIQEKVDIRGEKNIGIYINEDNKEEEVQKNRIDKYYDAILEKFGIKNSYQARAYRSFLLNLPIRTQIQFLSEFEDISKINMKETNVTNPFLSDLYEKRINIDIAKSNRKYLNPIILKLLVNERVLDEAYQLQPTTIDVSLNSSLMSLSFLFSIRTIDDPYLIFDYMVKIGYLRNLLSDLNYQDKKTSNTAGEISFESPSIEGLCHHSAIYGDKVLKDVVCYITAYLQATLDRDRKGSKNLWGMIRLPGLGKRQNQKKDPIPWRIDDVFQNKKEQKIAFLPLSVSENRRGQGYPVYSVYVLLSAIGELIRKVQQADLSKGILELSQIRSYPMPAFDGVSSRGILNIDISEIKNNEINDYLNEKIIEWVNHYPQKKCISPHLLGKISTRFFYSLGYIEHGRETDRYNLGQSMHRRIVVLMNSILVEDTKENLDDVAGLNLSNPTNSSKIFIDNIKAAAKAIEKVNREEASATVDLTFSKWMLSCPLFLLYLNTEDKDRNDNLKDVLLSFISGKGSNEILKNSIFKELSKVKYVEPTEQLTDVNRIPIMEKEMIDSRPMFRSRRESERQRVIKELEFNLIPMEWFENKESKSEQEKLNKLIRDKTVGLFQEDYLKADWIRHFRNYLEEKNIKWLHIL